MLKRLLPPLFLILLALPAWARVPERLEVLYEVMGLSEVLEIMAEEGTDYGAELQTEMLPGSNAQEWGALVAAIYDPARLEALFAAHLDQALEGQDLTPIVDFFASDRGKRIVGLELSARRAMLDDAVEAAAGEQLEQMVTDEDPRLDMLRDFVAVNDLVEMNVVGGMNSNYAFYTGLIDGGAFEQELTEEQILSDVWSQEPEIRFETEEWLYSYLAMAYRPLSDADLAAYTEFSGSAPGRAINQALFAAFDVMFTDISRALGRGAAKFMQGEDI